MDGYSFTERTRKVLALARDEAARLSYEYIGTEHILLGLIVEGEGVAATVLQNLGVNLDTLRTTIERTAKPGQGTVTGPDLPYASRSKKVIELSMAQARNLKHSYVGTEHLLLALLAEQTGMAAQVLVEAGVTLQSVKTETLQVLGAELPAAAPTVAKSQPIPALSARIRAVLTEARATRGSSHAESPLWIAILLLRQREGSACAVLDRLGVDAARVLETLESEAADKEARASAVGEGQLIMMADQERDATLTDEVGTGHLLIALLETTPSVADVFAEHRITAAAVRRELARISG